jgi:hypothetical protein
MMSSSVPEHALSGNAKGFNATVPLGSTKTEEAYGLSGGFF